MATIEKRTTKDGKTTYRVKVRLLGFPSESATFDARADAKSWAAATESNIKAGRYFGQSKRHTFEQLAAEYEAHAKRPAHLEYWRNVFGPERLDAITPARIARERDKLLAGTTSRKDSEGKPQSRAGATVNRYLAALSSCLSFGVTELQWLERNPVERIKKPPESKGRVRFLSDEERPRLIEACRNS